MHGWFAEVAPRPAGWAPCAMHRCVARAASSLRDGVRAADLPLPVAAVAASVCSFVIVMSGGGAP
jgi:hypothetical protein